jgi:hypothetical protein
VKLIVTTHGNEHRRNNLSQRTSINRSRTGIGGSRREIVLVRPIHLAVLIGALDNATDSALAAVLTAYAKELTRRLEITGEAS